MSFLLQDYRIWQSTEMAELVFVTKEQAHACMHLNKRVPSNQTGPSCTVTLFGRSP